MRDYYDILGLIKTSTKDDIKKAYKKLAFKYHPDKNKLPGASEKFRDISEAYDILSDIDKRRMYDSFGYEAVSGMNLHINPIDLFQSLFNVDFTGIGENMHSNIFMFSDLSSSPLNHLKNNMTYNLECSLEELYHGTQKEFQVIHRTHKGNKSTKYIINIKKGSKHGDNIIVKDGGNFIPALNLTEDLAIQIVEIDHPIYKRNENDLYIVENISLCEALTGVELHINHFNESLKVNISDIVKPNQMFQVFNKGMPIKHEEKSLGNGSDTEYGNLIIDLHIEFPDSISDKQGDLLKKLLIHLDRKENKGQLVQAYYYKEKAEVVKELMNDEEEGGQGCIQQ